MLQVKFLLVGLLLAAAFIGYQWLDSQPPIPPVELPASGEPDVADAAGLELDERQLLGLAGREGLPEPVGSADFGASDIARVASVDVLPALNDSDGWLREKLASTALPWLAETELVRTSATVLANAARGEVPRKFVEFLAPDGGFTVANMGGRIIAASTSHARYSNFVTSLTRVEPAYAAELFAAVEPLLLEALRELGGDADGKVATPRELATAALDIALATPTDGVANAPLVQPNVIYKYADESLEELAPLQKQLLRMGPENLTVLRPWLETFAAAVAAQPLGEAN